MQTSQSEAKPGKPCTGGRREQSPPVPLMCAIAHAMYTHTLGNEEHFFKDTIHSLGILETFRGTVQILRHKDMVFSSFFHLSVLAATYHSLIVGDGQGL